MDFCGLFNAALGKAGKQEQLATMLDLSPTALSKRINGETGWHEREFNKLLEIAGCEVFHADEMNRKVNTLKDAMKIMLNI